MDILKELYYGNVLGADRKTTPQEKRKLEIEYTAYDKLKEKLSPEQLELFDNYVKVRDKRECLSEANAYKYGFKIGLQIGTQSYIK